MIPHKNKEKELAFKVVGLKKEFQLGDSKKVQVLKGVSFDVHAGEILAIRGASGAGKSTLLHILGLLDKPSFGKVYFQGQDMTQWSDSQASDFRNRSVGFVFQFHYLLPEFTALENVMMPGWIGGYSDRLLRPEAQALLEAVGLAHRQDHRPYQLSGGESCRVALARALMMNPSVILADEPTGNLDAENAARVVELLQSWNRSRQLTLLLVTHDDEIARIAHRSLELKEGFLL